MSIAFLKLPQNNRKITASILGLTRKAISFGLFLLLGIIAYLNFHTQLFPENEEYTRLKLETLKQPSNYANFVNLALFLNDHGLTDQSSYYFKISQTLFDNYYKGDDSSLKILGEQTSPDTIMQNLTADKEYLQQKADYWQRITTEKPFYRDGYLQLAKINYQLAEYSQAKRWITQAFEIDPFYPFRKEYEAFLIQN